MKHLEPKKIVLIGASTGGPGQIQKIIAALPKLQNTTIVIAQHMIDGFMDSFASRFHDKSHYSISVVADNQIFEKNNIYICEGETKLTDNMQYLASKALTSPKYETQSGECPISAYLKVPLPIVYTKNLFSKKSLSLNSYNPNINILFNSFVSLCDDKEILCVLLTGIGDDGVQACKNLSLNGARCLTESKESAIVDGMPSQARAVVPNIEVYDIQIIVQIISEFCE